MRKSNELHFNIMLLLNKFLNKYNLVVSLWLIEKIHKRR